jgi:hypothetical protein
MPSAAGKKQSCSCLFNLVPKKLLILFMFLLYWSEQTGDDNMRFLIVLLLVLGLLATPVFAEANDTNDTNDTNVTVVNISVNDTEVNITENITDTNVTTNDTTVNVSANVTENLSDTLTSSNITIDESEVGALPGDFTYGFQRFFENVDKFFTFDKAEKAKKNAKYGKLRSIEAHLLTRKAQQYMADNNLEGANNTLELAKSILADYEQESTEAQENIEEALEEGSANETDVAEVQTELRNSIIVLQRVYEKVPESAKAGIARALNNSINNQEKHEQKMQEKLAKKLGKKAPQEAGAAVETDENGTESDETEENETETTEAGNKKPKGKPETPGKGLGKAKNQTDSDDDDEETETEENEIETEENETNGSSNGNGNGNGNSS